LKPETPGNGISQAATAAGWTMVLEPRRPWLGLPPFLFSMAGTVIWSYFAACLTKTSATFTADAGLFGKVMDTI